MNLVFFFFFPLREQTKVETESLKSRIETKNISKMSTKAKRGYVMFELSPHHRHPIQVKFCNSTLPTAWVKEKKKTNNSFFI